MVKVQNIIVMTNDFGKKDLNLVEILLKLVDFHKVQV